MQLTELVRNYQLPHKVKLPNDHRNSEIVLNVVGIDLSTGPIDLQQLEEEVYLQGNAVNFGKDVNIFFKLKSSYALDETI